VAGSGAAKSGDLAGSVLVWLMIVSGVVWLARANPGVFILCLLVGVHGYTVRITRSGPGEPWRPPRFSIRQIMIAVAVVAVLAGFSRWAAVTSLDLAGRLPGVAVDPASTISARAAGIFMATTVAGYFCWVIIAPWWGLFSDRREGGSMFGLSKKERREKVLETPFPADWSAILDKNVPILKKLPEADRAQLQGLIQCFLAEKVFEGCAGLEITDEIRVTIAAQACLLLLRRETDIYPNLITVLVYPSGYVSEEPRHTPRGLVTEGPQGQLGEAWTTGVVVLSWDDVRMGAADVKDGHNVVIHEFAHQLDQEDGSADGAPILPHRSLYTAWSRILGAEYQELREAAEKGKKSVLDEYGATEPAEFFAVATEAFFEKPVQLRKKHPELYEELKTYYAQDPEAVHVANPARRTGPRPKL